MRSLSRYVEGLRVPTYPTIWERTSKLDMALDGVRTDQPISIAMDSSGIKVTNSGDWMRKKWKVKKGYLKIHLAVDAKSKEAVSMQVTEEVVSDGSQAEALVKDATSKNEVERVFGDGAYDRGANFNLLASNGIDPAIKVRKNARPGRPEGFYARKKEVIAQQTDFEGWKEKKRYGARWGRRGSLLGHQVGLRRVRLSEEVREHGKGDGHKGVTAQRVHADDSAWRRIVV